MIVKQYLVLSMYLYVDTRPYPLDRTASSSLQPFKVILAPRGHAEIILVADFPECGYALQPTSVRLHTHFERRDLPAAGLPFYIWRRRQDSLLRSTLGFVFDTFAFYKTRTFARLKKRGVMWIPGPVT